MQRGALSLILNRAAMGYFQKENPEPFDAVKWVEEEYDAFHPWSIRKRLYDYGYYDFQKIFGTPQEYLATPPDLVEMIKSEVTRGAQQRMKDDARRPDGGADKDPLKLLDNKAFDEIIKGKNF